jgi:hypothetical protein
MLQTMSQKQLWMKQQRKLKKLKKYLSLRDTEVDYFTDEASCETVFTNYGCLNEGSYILDYHLQFWADGELEESEENYVSGYAASSLEEDFSESFAYFVLTQTPKANKIVDEKILWFYQYEELVQLRAEILSRVSTWMIRSVAIE